MPSWASDSLARTSHAPCRPGSVRSPACIPVTCSAASSISMHPSPRHSVFVARTPSLRKAFREKSGGKAALSPCRGLRRCNRRRPLRQPAFSGRNVNRCSPRPCRFWCDGITVKLQFLKNVAVLSGDNLFKTNSVQSSWHYGEARSPVIHRPGGLHGCRSRCLHVPSPGRPTETAHCGPFPAVMPPPTRKAPCGAHPGVEPGVPATRPRQTSRSRTGLPLCGGARPLNYTGRGAKFKYPISRDGFLYRLDSRNACVRQKPEGITRTETQEKHSGQICKDSAAEQHAEFRITRHIRDHAFGDHKPKKERDTSDQGRGVT